MLPSRGNKAATAESYAAQRQLLKRSNSDRHDLGLVMPLFHPNDRHCHDDALHRTLYVMNVHISGIAAFVSLWHYFYVFSPPILS